MTRIERLVLILEHKHVMDEYAGGSSLGGFFVAMALINYLCRDKL